MSVHQLITLHIYYASGAGSNPKSRIRGWLGLLPGALQRGLSLASTLLFTYNFFLIEKKTKIYY